MIIAKNLIFGTPPYGDSQFPLQNGEPEMQQDCTDNILVALVLFHANDANTCAWFFSTESLRNAFDIGDRQALIIIIIAHVATLFSINLMCTNG